MHSLILQSSLLFTAAWYASTASCHDLFVIRQHKTGYDKNLMRLLMDGHVLILSGVLMLMSWLMIRQGVHWGYIIGAIVALFMIVYCAMIFPFLKSFGTLLISILVFLVCILQLMM
jgi:hypothetical protein